MDILHFLDLGRAKSIQNDILYSQENNCETIILDELKDFGIDLVYFNTDEESQNSFPAVFLKKVPNFKENAILKEIAEIHRKVWNYKKVLFLYVYSETEIRIYNCTEKPLIVTQDNFNFEKELKKLEIQSYIFTDKENLQELKKLFSRVAIDTGIIWTIDEAKFIRDKINLQKRVDRFLVDSFVNASNFLKNQGLPLELIHKVILRSLFLLYLEDRGAAEKEFYSQFKIGATSYFDILEDVDATYELYKKLAVHFNGNVFTIEDSESRFNKEQLQIIKLCFIRGREKNDSKQLFDDDWTQFRLFNFKIIQIELLSEIYENFLAETDPTVKEDSGTYYTPPSLVEFILNDKLPVNNREKDFRIKILDPSCGSGIFLVESFKRVVKRYENANNLKSLSDFEVLVDLLKKYIFGIEINPQAIKVAAFSLYLALLDKLNPKDLWQSKKYRLPYLINDPEEKDKHKIGENLFLRDTISDLSSIDELKNFQLIVGNPPFGKILTEEKDKKGKHKNLRDYCIKHKLPKEMVLPFLRKATLFAPDGEIALIFKTKVLTNTSGNYPNFRDWLFNKCYVEKVFNFSILRNAPKTFGGQLFGDATGPISIVYYKKKELQNPSDTIVYYAPKTYVRSNIIEGLSIDFSDIKYLPRIECQNPNTKIWKVAMWGTNTDFELLKSIFNQFPTLYSVFEKNRKIWKKSTGLLKASSKNIENNKGITVKGKIIDTTKIIRYYTKETSLFTTDKLFNPKRFEEFTPPFLLIKEGQQDWKYCATIIDYEALFLKSALGIKCINNDIDIKILCALINSSFAKYFLSLISSSWGIERERVQPNEILLLPYFFNAENLELNQKIASLVDSIIIAEKKDNKNEVSIIENEIDKHIFESFKFDDAVVVNILETITNSLDLLENSEDSIALYPVSEDQPQNYAQIITSELNDFLEGQNLFVNATIYKVNRFCPLMMIKLTHSEIKIGVEISDENIDDELKGLDKFLWNKGSTNIYFRKKLNYKKGDDIYIIRPNQRRFWSQSMAFEDASELILEILNGVHDEA